MSNATAVPVLIVGAGPAGLTLACDLARRNVPCRVIDKLDRLFIGSRGKGLQPRTLEVFHDLGVIDDILVSGAPFPDFRCYAGEQVAWDRSLAQMLGIQAPAATPDVPYPSAWIIPQWRTDEILHARLVQLGGQVELSTELVGFEQDRDGVTATIDRGGIQERVRTDYLVGTDGGHSFVRKGLGVGFAGETFETERTVIGDVRVDRPLDHEHCHLLTRTGNTSNSERFTLWGLPGTEYFQLVVNVSTDEVPALTLGAMQAMLEQRSGRRDIRLHDLRWISLYRINVRMADRFRVGRVFLAGDAAHVHSSAGGQGLNASVQDAYNLGWKLGAVLAGAPPELLDTYEAERFPVAADLLGITTSWHRQDFGSPPTGRERGSDHKLFQLSLNYRGGPLAWEDRSAPGSVRAGDRAPDAPCCDAAGIPTRLFDVFRGPHFTLLAFGTDARAVVAQIGSRYNHIVHRVTFCIEDAAAVLTRIADMRFDLIFADTWVGKYTHLEEVLGLLKEGGLYVIDDMLPQANWPDGHAEKVRDLMAVLEARQELAVTKLSWASGIIVAAKRKVWETLTIPEWMKEWAHLWKVCKSVVEYRVWNFQSLTYSTKNAASSGSSSTFIPKGSAVRTVAHR